MSNPSVESSISEVLDLKGHENALHLAAYKGDRNALKILTVNAPIRIIDVKDHSGRTPLMRCILQNHPECAAVLLKAGARIDNSDNEGQTALHMAVRKDLYHCAKLLLANGAMWYQMDCKGVTALHAASAQSSAKCLALILKKMKPGEVDTQDSNKRTALHWSAACANVEHTKLLLEKGANICIPDIEGKIPLHYVACSSSRHSLKCMKIILGKEPSAINWQDYEGHTALHLAACRGYTQVVEYLTSQPTCNMDILDNSFRTPLHLAALKGQSDKVALLLDRGAVHTFADGYGATAMHYAAYDNKPAVIKEFLCRSYVVDQPDKDGRNSLIWAAARNSVDVIKVMSRFKKVNICYMDNNNSTALHAAAIQGHASTVELLLMLKVPIDSKDNSGMTPFLRACEAGRFKVAVVLLRHGAELAVTDNHNSGCLHWSASGGHAYLSQMLIERGCSFKVKDDFGMTPLHYAAAGGYAGCVSIILEYRADPDVSNSEGLTPLHLAAMNGHLNVIKMLLQRGAYLNCMAMLHNKWITPMDYALKNVEHIDVAIFLKTVGCLTACEIQIVAAKKIQIWFRYVQAHRQKRSTLKCLFSNKADGENCKHSSDVTSCNPIQYLKDKSNNMTATFKKKDENNVQENAAVVIQTAWKRFLLKRKMVVMRQNISEAFSTESRTCAERLLMDSIEMFLSQL